MTPRSTAIPILRSLLELAAQLLIADNPDLLLPPEVIVLRTPPRLARARVLLAMTRDTYAALDAYENERLPGRAACPDDDELPF